MTWEDKKQTKEKRKIGKKPTNKNIKILIKIKIKQETNGKEKVQSINKLLILLEVKNKVIYKELLKISWKIKIYTQTLSQIKLDRILKNNQILEMIQQNIQAKKSEIKLIKCNLEEAKAKKTIFQQWIRMIPTRTIHQTLIRTRKTILIKETKKIRKTMIKLKSIKNSNPPIDFIIWFH